jgi:hypothetical protein
MPVSRQILCSCLVSRWPVPHLLTILIVSFVLLLSAGLSYGSEIDIYYTDLGGKLTLTATQGGNLVGDPSCDANTCSLSLEGLFGGDFPTEDLVAAVESVASLQAGIVPPVFTDVVTYSAVDYEDPAGQCNAHDPTNCADISLDFYAEPFSASLQTPVFQQPPADGIEHEMSPFFENLALSNNIVVGLPPAAIHVFVTADGANVPEPPSGLLAGSVLLGLCFLRRVLWNRPA